MSYYKNNREAILEYQRSYNLTHRDTIRQYQKEYFQKNKKPNKVKKVREEKIKARKALPKYKIDALERMLKQKLRDYNESIEQIQRAIKIVNDKSADPLAGFDVRGGLFTLTFE